MKCGFFCRNKISVQTFMTGLDKVVQHVDGCEQHLMPEKLYVIKALKNELSGIIFLIKRAREQTLVTQRTRGSNFQTDVDL